MIEKSELLRVPAFEGLPDDQLDWFISQSEEIQAEGREMCTCDWEIPRTRWL